MADFDPPFGQDGERRLPNANEQSLGWPCGAIDQALLNGLFHLHNGNIGDVINEAGITGPDGDLTKLRRAIEALISAATGGGTADDFVIMTQARNRLPIFPDVQNVDGRISVTAPSTGTVRLAGGVEFLHRGIFRVTTTQTDFSTDPSKTYHLRWHRNDGFVLRDLASGSYNPSTLSESNVAFDSDYDDMLIARVVTNASNVATITTLANKDRVNDAYDMVVSASAQSYQNGLTTPGNVSLIAGAGVAIENINLARTPGAAMQYHLDADYGRGDETNVGVRVDSRYRITAFEQNTAQNGTSMIGVRVWL